MSDSKATSTTVGFGICLYILLPGGDIVECWRWSGGGSSLSWVRCGFGGKFNELMPILTMSGTSLKVKGKIYKACVQSVMMYGSETWEMKVEGHAEIEENRGEYDTADVLASL